MSCNGCRVLRKGCSDACILRSSLRWIESPEAQGHATVFVAKFFGRAGMMSFINAVSESQRPALFQSLLYEACGRIVNPVFGAVGLLWSGNWGQCQAAVEIVLKGGSPQPAATCMPALPTKPAHTTACRPNLPPATGPFSRPSASFNTGLEMPMPQSAQPITQEPPLKRAKSFVQQREQRPPQQEVSNVTSEAVSLSQERSNGLIFRHANQNSSCDFSEIIKCRENHESTAPCGQLHAPVPRRVKQKPQSPNSPSLAIIPVQTWKEEDAAVKQAVHDTIELDLTLNSHGNHADIGGWNRSSLPFMPVSSPSSFSVNSEGSVTNSDTAEYTISCLRTLSAQAHSHAEDRKLLRLL